MTNDNELAILESIYGTQRRDGSQLTQRDLAQSSGLSLGMTNAMLKRFVEKGWVMIRKINSRNIHYALTSAGISEIAHRTYGYFKRTARNVSVYKEILDTFVSTSKKNGVNTIVLGGTSDFDFILEYLCDRHGLLFVKTTDFHKALRLAKTDSLVVQAESIEESADGNAVRLKELIIGPQVAAAYADGEYGL